jgi:K+:H+ antiporter
LETIRPRPSILVPVTGTATSRRGAEFAIGLAQASRGTVTVLHFVARSQDLAAARSWQREVGAAIAPTSSADAVIREIVKLGDPYGVAVKPAVQSAGTSQDAILHQIESGRHNLVVMGVSIRPGEHLDFGQTAAALLDKAKCSLMFVVSEPLAPVAETSATLN